MSECPTDVQQQNDDIADSWEDVCEEQVSAQIEQKQRLLQKQKEAEEALRKLSLEQAADSASLLNSPNGPNSDAQNFKILQRPQFSTGADGRRNAKQSAANDKMKSLEERQAAYQEARDRIFGKEQAAAEEGIEETIPEEPTSKSPPPEETGEPPKRTTSKNHLSDVPMKESLFIPQAWEAPTLSAPLNNVPYQQFIPHMTPTFTTPVVIPQNPSVMGMPPPPPNYQVVYPPGSSSVCVTVPPSAGFMSQPYYGANPPFVGLPAQPSQPPVNPLPPQVARPVVTPSLSPHPHVPNLASVATSAVQPSRGVFYPPNGATSTGGSISGSNNGPSSGNSGVPSSTGRVRKLNSIPNTLNRNGRPPSNPTQRPMNSAKPRQFEQKNVPTFPCDFTRPPPPISNNNNNGGQQANLGPQQPRPLARATFSGQRPQGQPQR